MEDNFKIDQETTVYSLNLTKKIHGNIFSSIENQMPVKNEQKQTFRVIIENFNSFSLISSLKRKLPDSLKTGENQDSIKKKLKNQANQPAKVSCSKDQKKYSINKENFV